jgi:hypothetical protein
MYGSDEKFTQTSAGKSEGRDHLRNLGIDGSVLKKWALKMYTGFF